MKPATKLFTATFVIGAIGAATFTLPGEAAPITALAGLQNAAGADVQTVQWRSNRGEPSTTGTQYGDDYEYYGPRYGSSSSRSRNRGEPSTTGTQYGDDYENYGPRRRTPKRR